MPLSKAFEDPCMICLEEYGQPSEDRIAEQPVRLPCGHIYGEKCLRQWMATRPSSICTLCRRSFGISGDAAAAVATGAHDRPISAWFRLMQQAYEAESADELAEEPAPPSDAETADAEEPLGRARLTQARLRMRQDLAHRAEAEAAHIPS